MDIGFYKYHGAGNDFIMIDAREKNESDFTERLVKMLCNRHLGIGADGLILLLNDIKSDFRMKYFNSDGKEGTMCGNGGRCITSFARRLGIINNKAIFSGIDGLHESIILDKKIVSLKMVDVSDIKVLSDGYLVETGSTHFVSFRNDLRSMDVFKEGRELRHQTRFGVTGTNVNFVQIIADNELNVRTYERGVENETLACGTGAVASAIIAYLRNNTDKTSFLIHAPGGDLLVNFNPDGQGSYKDIWLKGPVEFIYKGEIGIENQLNN